MTGKEFLEKIQKSTHTKPDPITDDRKDIFFSLYQRDFGNADPNVLDSSYNQAIDHLKTFTLPTAYESEALYPILYEQLSSVFDEGKKRGILRSDLEFPTIGTAELNAVNAIAATTYNTIIVDRMNVYESSLLMAQAVRRTMLLLWGRAKNSIIGLANDARIDSPDTLKKVVSYIGSFNQ